MKRAVDDLVISLFSMNLKRLDGVFVGDISRPSENERQTSAAFSEKWTTLKQADSEDEGWKKFQFRWYLSCYGYDSEQALAQALAGKKAILDAGCGPGYKAAWLARMNPSAIVVAMDQSKSIFVAADRYRDYPNLLFVKGDIARTPFRDGVFDFVNCDQVLHHTADPPQTVKEFARILSDDGQLNTYVYAKKALPRELLDEYVRDHCKQMSSEQLWDLSNQLTRLGRMLSEIEVTLDVPDIPALGIKGGPQDLQRFFYWNFLKCFWNPEHGFEASKMINFDWYAPSTAFRYSRAEFEAMLSAAGFRPDFLHSEEACHSGRFGK